MNREQWIEEIVQPLEQIRRYERLIEYAKNNMKLCQDIDDKEMYKFWKKQYWQSYHTHAMLNKEFYEEGNKNEK